MKWSSDAIDLQIINMDHHWQIRLMLASVLVPLPWLLIQFYSCISVLYIPGFIGSLYTCFHVCFLLYCLLAMLHINHVVKDLLSVFIMFLICFAIAHTDGNFMSATTLTFKVVNQFLTSQQWEILDFKSNAVTTTRSMHDSLHFAVLITFINICQLKLISSSLASVM